jgi:endonuclease/exonuclease/phosphatase (EEP) superfamily protein YafD
MRRMLVTGNAENIALRSDSEIQRFTDCVLRRANQNVCMMKFAYTILYVPDVSLSLDYTAVEQTLTITAANARQTVLRFRDRFRRYLREEIAETIADTDEQAIDRELEELQRILRDSAR